MLLSKKEDDSEGGDKEFEAKVPVLVPDRALVLMLAVPCSAKGSSVAPIPYGGPGRAGGVMPRPRSPTVRDGGGAIL